MLQCQQYTKTLIWQNPVPGWKVVRNEVGRDWGVIPKVLIREPESHSGERCIRVDGETGTL